MQKAASIFLALMCLPLASVAQSQAAPSTVNLRFSEQFSNAPPASCGCFGLEGVAADAAWNFVPASGKRAIVAFAVDAGVEHTGKVSNADYGLTLTTVSAGPRFLLPTQKLDSFVQVLFGFAHGSNSEFPKGNTLVPSASSFAFDLGAGADYPLHNRHVSVRVLQVDYLRTGMPNITSNWQNNLRIGAGVTWHFTSGKKH